MTRRHSSCFKGSLKQWRIKVVGGPFYIYETVVCRKIIDERTEVFVLSKQKKLDQKKNR